MVLIFPPSSVRINFQRKSAPSGENCLFYEQTLSLKGVHQTKEQETVLFEKRIGGKTWQYTHIP